MARKRILCPERLRRVPKQFSWVDHRLIREKRICGLSHGAMALYLFLVTVADAQGLSYYSDPTAGRLLGMQADILGRARGDLCRAGLIAYEHPLYQVLCLDDSQPGWPARQPNNPPRARSGKAVAIGEVIGQIMGGA